MIDALFYGIVVSMNNVWTLYDGYLWNYIGMKVDNGIGID